MPHRLVERGVSALLPPLSPLTCPTRMGHVSRLLGIRTGGPRPRWRPGRLGVIKCEIEGDARTRWKGCRYPRRHPGVDGAGCGGRCRRSGSAGNRDRTVVAAVGRPLTVHSHDHIRLSDTGPGFGHGTGHLHPRMAKSSKPTTPTVRRSRAPRAPRPPASACLETSASTTATATPAPGSKASKAARASTRSASGAATSWASRQPCCGSRHAGA